MLYPAVAVTLATMFWAVLQSALLTEREPPRPAACTDVKLPSASWGMPDHEPYRFLHSARASDLSPEEAKKTAEEERIGLVEFLHGSDILILDAQYTDTEYEKHVGWGHGSISSAVSLALDAEVRKLLLFHHDPGHDDAMLDAIVDDARRLVRESGKDLEVDGAREGDEILLK